MFARLDVFARAVRLERGDANRDMWIALALLRKRAFSSAKALWLSVTRRLDGLAGVAPESSQLLLPLDEHGESTDADEPPPWQPVLGLGDAVRERRLLTSLAEAAGTCARDESKCSVIRRLLGRIREPIIVFTEYRDTLAHLARQIDEPVVVLHGGLSRQDRLATLDRFARGTVRILLATDAAAEGLNLHHACRTVVNLELPWNPMRLEQRIGRVDRIGQERAVHAITLVARDTAEDLVIANLAGRLARVVATLGERDRLGAFLTDARTARMVIGGAAPEEACADAVPTETMTREPAVGAAAIEAADRLARRRTAVSRGFRLEAEGDSRDTLVSTLRASDRLASGVVLVIECRVQTEDGDPIASRVAILHARGDMTRPPTLAAARALAAMAIEALPPLPELIPGLAGWVETATHVHQRSIDNRLARESALLGRTGAPKLLQPGLFDRRAVRAAEELAEGERSLQAEHHRQIAVLERARSAHLSFTPIAVLIVWR